VEHILDKCVSVIVPVYNVEKYVVKCVKSLLQQTYQNLEIILVDDGSTDSSYKECVELAHCDNRIKLFHQDNFGVASARNKGLELATGEYVTFVDADDTVKEKYIEKLYCAICDGNYDIVFCGYEHINVALNITTKICLSNLAQGDLMIDFSRLFFSRCENVLSFSAAKLFRMSIIRRHGIKFDCQYRWGEDQIFNLMYFSYVKKYCFLPESLYQYYIHGRGSAVETFSKLRVDNESDMVIFWSQWLWEKNITNKDQILNWKLAVLLRNAITGYIRNDRSKNILKKYIYYIKFLSNLRQTFALIHRTINFKQLLVIKCINNEIHFPVFVYYFLFKK